MSAFLLPSSSSIEKSFDAKVFSCTVGKKPSHARNFLNDVDEVHALLESIIRSTKV